MDVNSLPKTVTGQRRGCDLNPGPSAPESSTLTSRLPSHPRREMNLILNRRQRNCIYAFERGYGSADVINECIVARRGIRGVAIFIHQQDVVDAANCPPAPHHNITVGRRLLKSCGCIEPRHICASLSTERQRERES